LNHSKYNLKGKNMFVKRLSLYLCVISFFSLNQVEAVLGEEYFKQKKYAFSEPILNEIKAFSAIAMKGVSITNDEAEEVFLRMWEEALEGNEKVQEKLFCLFSRSVFLEIAKNRVPLLADETKYSLKILMDMAIEQGKSWAFYQKALTENKRGKKFTLLNQAMNNPYIEETLLEKIAAERNTLIRECGLPIPSAQNKNEIKKFIEHYKNYKNGGLLYDVYQRYKDSSKFFSNECFKAASELGYFFACIDQANEFFSKGDFENNYKWSLKPAKMNDPTSMHNVGYFLVNNGQVEEGLKWFLKASEAGFVESMYSAAHILSKSFNGPVSQAKSFNLMKTAAQLDHMKASRKYAKMLKDGFVGHEPNLAEAADLFLKVIKSDDAEQKDKLSAMYHYGRLLKDGFEGQRPNMNLGYEWILKAAKNGCPAAMNHYGGFLMGWMDDGVEKNAAAAYRWFLKAAKAGDHASMCNVGEILWFGVKGVKQNRKAAKEWLYQAANVGYLDAMIFLSRDLLSETIEEGVSAEEKEKLLKEGARLLSLAYDCNYFACLVGSDLLLINKNKFKFNSDPDIKFDNDTSQQSDVVQMSVKPYVALKAKHIISFDQLLKNERIIHDKTQKKIKQLIRSAFRVELKDKFDSLVNLAKLYFNGYVDGEKNIKKAFELLLPIAKNNHVEAM
jgi:TPR repeat protein